MRCISPGNMSATSHSYSPSKVTGSRVHVGRSLTVRDNAAFRDLGINSIGGTLPASWGALTNSLQTLYGPPPH
jgi:hypothetical protein